MSLESEAAEVRVYLEKSGALMEGHFRLASGRHTEYYLNSLKVLQKPVILEAICKIMSPYFDHLQPEFFACPSEAANSFAYQLALTYCHRHPSGTLPIYLYGSKGENGFVFKRGQASDVKGLRGVVVDDIGTTGGSVQSVVDLVRASGGKVPGVSYLCIRSDDVTLESVGDVEYLYTPLRVDFPSYPNIEECPEELRRIPIDTTIGHGAEYVAKHGQLAIAR